MWLPTAQLATYTYASLGLLSTTFILPFVVRPMLQDRRRVQMVWKVYVCAAALKMVGGVFARAAVRAMIERRCAQALICARLVICCSPRTSRHRANVPCDLRVHPAYAVSDQAPLSSRHRWGFRRSVQLLCIHCAVT
eukprot:SAG31_NODE_13045_length_896_cov_1.583438_1_plen_137_part_00